DLLAHVERRRAVEAEAHFEAALRLDPGSAAAHRGLGFVKDLQGHPLEAQRHYRQALEFDPADPLAAVDYGYSLLGALFDGAPGASAAMAEEARAQFRRAAALDPRLAEADAGLSASYLYERKVPAEALEAGER